VVKQTGFAFQKLIGLLNIVLQIFSDNHTITRIVDQNHIVSLLRKLVNSITSLKDAVICYFIMFFYHFYGILTNYKTTKGFSNSFFRFKYLRHYVKYWDNKNTILTNFLCQIQQSHLFFSESTDNFS
jgi:hypothetical protein